MVADVLVDAIASNSADWLRNRFCQLPWAFVEIHSDGSIFTCCPRYSAFKKIGNIFADDPAAIWNSVAVQDFRRGILDGSFAMCNHVMCPQISGRHLPDKASIRDPYFREVIRNNVIEAPRLPMHVKLVHDDSCNLSCPSCRDTVVVAKKARQAELDRVLNGFIMPFIRDCRILELSGDGDPFASKHYRDILSMTAERYPRMGISLHTNGVLCDEASWRDLRLENRVNSVLVSIDAAQKSTYEIVRRGGNWERLSANLQFLMDCKRRRQVKSITLAFVVQTQNFREMANFVKWGKALGVDSVSFSLIYDWDRAHLGARFKDMQIWSEDHPLHDEFVKTLRDPIFDDPIVSLGDTDRFRIKTSRGRGVAVGG